MQLVIEVDLPYNCDGMIDSIEEMKFEAALVELEQTVARLESGNLTLEDSLELFERGQRLAAHCNRLLDQAQLRVEQLTDDGEIVTLSLPNS
ncbi:MAG: exodeoxyribonuclease VII small subunit [Chloroflexota bacterium]